MATVQMKMAAAEGNPVKLRVLKTPRTISSFRAMEPSFL